MEFYDITFTISKIKNDFLSQLWFVQSNKKGIQYIPPLPTYMINWIKVITPNNIDFHILNLNLIIFYPFVMNSIWTILYSSSRDTGESDAFCSKCWLGIFTQYNMRGQWIPASKHHVGICIWVQTQGNDLKYNLLCSFQSDLTSWILIIPFSVERNTK